MSGKLCSADRQLHYGHFLAGCKVAYKYDVAVHELERVVMNMRLVLVDLNKLGYLTLRSRFAGKHPADNRKAAQIIGNKAAIEPNTFLERDFSVGNEADGNLQVFGRCKPARCGAPEFS